MEDELINEGTRAIEPVVEFPQKVKKTPTKHFSVKAEDFVLYEAIIKPKFDE